MAKFTVVKECTVTDTIVVEAESAAEAYQEALNEFQFNSDGKGNPVKPWGVSRDYNWLYTEVFEGDSEKVDEYTQPVLHINEE